MTRSFDESDSDTARVSALAGELRVLIGRLKRRLHEQSQTDDLTWSQKSVLVRLEREGPLTVTALARGEGMRSQSMGANVAALEAAGLVRGEPDPADGRQTLLSLTPDCLDMIRAGRAAREDWLFGVIQTKLTPEERETLAAGLALLRRLVD